MAVRSKNAHYKMSTIQRRHWSEVAKINGMGENFESVIQQFMNQATTAIEAVAKRLPPHFPQVVSDTIFEGIRAQVKRPDQQGGITDRRQSVGLKIRVLVVRFRPWPPFPSEIDAQFLAITTGSFAPNKRRITFCPIPRSSGACGHSSVKPRNYQRHNWRS